MDTIVNNDVNIALNNYLNNDINGNVNRGKTQQTIHMIILPLEPLCLEYQIINSSRIETNEIGNLQDTN